MKIGVIGLGLIGGSIFKKLEELNKYEVVGVSTSISSENIGSDYAILLDCDLVFVCTPMSVTISALKRLENYVSPNTIVTDVCSLKSFVSKGNLNYRFIPSHPMAGTEKSGWENSFPELFQNAKWVITPLNGEILPEQDVLEDIIKELGAKIVITTPEEHDKAVALISHMPMVVAQALCANIKDNKLAQELASSGFRDTTRLALSNSFMAKDMIELNNENIKTAIQSLQNELNNLLDEDYFDKIQNIKEFRKNLYN